MGPGDRWGSISFLFTRCVCVCHICSAKFSVYHRDRFFFQIQSWIIWHGWILNSDSVTLFLYLSHTHTCKCTSTLHIHTHTQASCTHRETNEWNSSPSIPFHGEFGWLRVCLCVCACKYFMCNYVAFFVLAASLCVRLLGVFTYTSHCLSVHMHTQLPL